MGLIDKNLNTYIKPETAKERTYAIFGKKLKNQDLEFFNNSIEMSLSKLKTRIKIFYSLFLLSITIFLILIFSPEDYWPLLMKLTAISLWLLFYTFIIAFLTHIWIGIYERSWIKLLELKDLGPKFSFLQKISGKSTSIVYPKVKSYLETCDISLFINESEMSYYAPSSKGIDEIISEHSKFDNSITKFNDTV